MEYFEEVLGRYERYQHSESLDEVAIECLSHLPVTLQQNAFALLVTQLIECLLEWKAHYDLGAYTDAVKVLDNENPTWREELPFLVLDEEAATLINKLLKRASQFKRRELNPIRVKRQLVPVGDAYRLTADIYIAREIHADDLARQLGGQTLPSMFMLSTHTSDGNRFRTATFTLRTGANAGWQVSSYQTSVKNAVAAGELSFSIDSDGIHVLDATYYRGEALAPNAPWVFEASGSMLTYIGQGSIKSNKGRLFVVSSVAPTKANRIASITDDGALINSELRVYEVAGEVDVAGISGCYRISCNSGESEEFKVTIETPEYVDLSAKHPVYRGIPRVTFTQTSDVQTIPDRELFWYRKGSKTITPLSEGKAIGEGVLVWRKEGTVLWEKPCVVLPEQFGYRLNSVDGAEFCLVIRNADQPKIGMLSGYENWIPHAPSYEANEIRLDFAPVDAKAEYLGVSFKWNDDEETECELEIPISFNVAVLSDRKGVPYREVERGSLTINDLPNLQVALRTDTDVQDVELVVNLYGMPTSDGRESVLMADRRGVKVDSLGGKSTIRGTELYAIANKLFGLIDKLDSYLRVEVYASNTRVPDTFPKITRYKHEPQFVDNWSAFTLRPTPTLMSIESPVLYLSPIWDFDRDPIELEPVDKTANVWRFELPNAKEVEYGPWLIWADAAMSVHPRIKNYEIPRGEQDNSRRGALADQLLRAFGEKTDQENVYQEPLKQDSLPYKVKYLDPNDRESLGQLNKAIRNMGYDINHPGWGYIDGVMKLIDSLDPLALYAMTSMQRNLRALAVLLFRDKERFNDSWELAERLGVSWYALDPQIWVKVLKQYFEKYKKEAEPLLEISEDTYWDFVYRPFAPFEARGPYFKYILDIATDRPAFEPVAIWDDEQLRADGLHDQTVGALFRSERNALMDRHKGKLLSRVGTKRTTNKFLSEVDHFWPSQDLPSVLHSFIEYTEAGPSASRTKQNAWTLTMSVPLKLGFCISGFYQMPRQKRLVLLLSQAISRVDEFDREWLQQVLIVAHMACELLKLEQRIENSRQHSGTDA